MNADAKVHTNHPLDTFRVFRRLALPLLLGLASIAFVVVQARGLRHAAEAAATTLTGGRRATASAGAAAGAPEPAGLAGGAAAAAEAAPGADARYPAAGAVAA
ncbi:MAG TPA: hypothetical protein VE075_03980, partial [Thermoanaerobaculia bacterium]|nr:hypothetical protein [Thermoanaerobaculia bacterium]